MTIPIIFIREFFPQAPAFDIRPALMMAKRWNPNGRVVLIGDDKQPKDFCEFFPIEDYSWNKKGLRQIFKARDGSKDWFLWTTLSQWLVTYEWMAEHNVSRACCLDTDVLVFCDVDAEMQKLPGWDLSLSCPTTSCQAPTFVSLEAVEYFTRFLFELFNHRADTDWENILAGEVDSMSLWSHYVRLCDPKPRVVDTSQIVDDTTWDHNLAMTYHGFEHDGQGKTMRFINGQPWCYSDHFKRPIRFNTLHMWSTFKNQMARYVKMSEDSMK